MAQKARLTTGYTNSLTLISAGCRYGEKMFAKINFRDEFYRKVNFTPTYRSGGFRIQCYLSPSFILLFDTGNPVRLYSLTPVFHPGFSSLSLHLKQHVPPYFCFFCHSDVFGRVPLRGLFHPAIPGSRKERSGVPLPQCSLLR